MNIRPGRYSRRALIPLKSTNRSGNFDINNNIIDISILIFLHPRCPRAHPSSQGRKLDWVRLMSATNPKFRQLFLHILSNNSSLDTSHHILFINPFYFVHPRHIHRYDCPDFLGFTHQCLSHVGPSELLS